MEKFLNPLKSMRCYIAYRFVQQVLIQFNFELDRYSYILVLFGFIFVFAE
jgi:hypothetical protein